MLDFLKKTFFSSKLLALLLFILTFTIGYATFFENDYGTPAAQRWIYKTHWFELVILLLGVNLIGNIGKYKLMQKKKMPVFLFHLAWIIIVIGAGVTRYYGYEGTMAIREGETSNTIMSRDTYTLFHFDDGVKQLEIDRPIIANKFGNTPFDYQLDFQGKNVGVQYVDFLFNAIDSVVEVADGKEILELVTVGQNGRQSVFLSSGETKMFGPYPIVFNGDEEQTAAIKINSVGNGLTVISPYDIGYLKMDDQSQGVLTRDSLQAFETRRLYSIGKVRVVLKNVFYNGEVRKIEVDKDSRRGEDILVVNVTAGEDSKQLYLPGGAGFVSPFTQASIGGLNFRGRYGAKPIPLPFAIKLNDFQLETYPGTESPSSFASEVTLIDEEQSIHQDHRIYMNHVLDHRGYRFFQSSYDPDLLGTVLSVNHDFWGTAITYIGYLLLTIGLLWTFVAKNTRFNSLRKQLRKVKAKRLKQLGLMALLIMSTSLYGADGAQIDANHAAKADSLIVQGSDGRFMPLQTYTSQLARKITTAKMYKGMTPTQLVLSMIYDRGYWQEKKMIKLDHPQLAIDLDADEVKVGMSKMYFVSFKQMFDENGYKLRNKVAKANSKPMAERDMYDKELIKLDERINICYLIFAEGAILKLFPNPETPDGAWHSNTEFEMFKDTSQLFVKHMIPLYMASVQESIEKNDWTVADKTIGYISDFQVKYGHHVLPSKKMVAMEIAYNRYNFFNRSMLIYLLAGFVLLIFSFFEVFYHNKFINMAQWLLIIIIAATFIFHGVGLGMRWWISGHAPWSNAYEALTFIAWGTILAGFLFVKSSRITMAATAVLAGMTLFVAWLNWLNPEITNLQPVLKSYWLTIHVAVITSSYAFLGLGAILGLSNLVLMIIRSKKNFTRIGDAIDELTYISEMTITIGVVAAAIGTFLGGVWANESWGRYWGWDPKETWALVVVLAYSIILHLRLVPSWRGRYLFNVVSLYGYGTVLMTFFGVNYYLSGLHSYAGGTPPPIPAFVYPTLVLFVVISVLAYFREKRWSK